MSFEEKGVWVYGVLVTIVSGVYFAKITRDDTGGASHIYFVVRKIQSYDPGEDASEVFVSNDGKPHLNLITCDGVWDKQAKQYSKRLVVFSDRI